MGIETDIEWCDSTLNLQMGCDGCELWNLKAGIKRCYAGTLTERYGNRKGWPESFGKPALFLDRLDKALAWPDLNGQERSGKPWLSDRPRMIFLDDMGDTFTESLPLDWLAPLLPRMAASPHHFMLLTKRARRMREFFRVHGCPENIWPGVSVTSPTTLSRVDDLVHIGARFRFVSVEPLWARVSLAPWIERLSLVIVGAESGARAEPSHPAWVRTLLDESIEGGACFFMKQWGEWLPYEEDAQPPFWNTQDGRCLDGHRFMPDWNDSRTAARWNDGLQFIEEESAAIFERVGKKAAGHLLDGVSWRQFPAVSS